MPGVLYDINVIYNPSTPETILVTIGDLAGGAPTGGIAGQALIKLSGANWDMDWDFVTGVPDGGTTGQTIQKTSAVDGEAAWADIVLVGNPASPPAGLGIGQLLWDQGAASPQDSVISARFSIAVGASITSGTAQALPWTVRSGDSSLWDVANPSRLIAPTAGIYLVNASTRWDSGMAVGGIVALYISKNGAAERFASSEIVNASGVGDTLHVSTAIQMAAGDYVNVMVLQNQGATHTINGNTTVTGITSATWTRLA